MIEIGFKLPLTSGIIFIVKRLLLRLAQRDPPQHYIPLEHFVWCVLTQLSSLHSMSSRFPSRASDEFITTFGESMRKIPQRRSQGCRNVCELNSIFSLNGIINCEAKLLRQVYSADLLDFTSQNDAKFSVGREDFHFAISSRIMQWARIECKTGNAHHMMTALKTVCSLHLKRIWSQVWIALKGQHQGACGRESRSVVCWLQNNQNQLGWRNERERSEQLVCWLSFVCVFIAVATVIETIN